MLAGIPVGEQNHEIDDDHIPVVVDYLAPTPCPWDLDNSGSVGITDFLALLLAWGTSPPGRPDFDCDSNVGITDFLTLLAKWGPCP